MAQRLGAWVAHTIGADAAVVEVTTPEGSGMSSETLLFTVQPGDAAPERYVARLAPAADAHYAVFPEYDLELQRKVMELVGEHTEVPVPRIAWYEPDAEFLGSSFLVMHRVDGIVPADIPPYPFGGWLADASPADRARLERSSVRALARIHDLTPETHDLAFLARPEHGASALDQQLGYQRAYYDWAREGATVPIIERAFTALDATRPAEGPAVLNWGDSRIGNVIFADFEPAAVLDWEMATIGPAEVDVAWMAFLHRFFDDMTQRFGMPGMGDFLALDRVAAIYEEESQRALHHLEWFEMLAALRFAIISVRTSMRTIAYGEAPAVDDLDDLIMFRPLLEEMLERVESP
jgi:aminoglycoside phosphotransferase (APT) family kinase protein